MLLGFAGGAQHSGGGSGCPPIQGGQEPLTGVPHPWVAVGGCLGTAACWQVTNTKEQAPCSALTFCPTPTPSLENWCKEGDFGVGASSPSVHHGGGTSKTRHGYKDIPGASPRHCQQGRDGAAQPYETPENPLLGTQAVCELHEKRRTSWSICALAFSQLPGSVTHPARQRFSRRSQPSRLGAPAAEPRGIL